MYPNSDPGMFWVAFYGCLLAEVIPVPIEVPLSRKVRSDFCEYRNVFFWGVFLFNCDEFVFVCVCF